MRSTARPRGGPAARRAAKRQSTWSLRSQHASASCSAAEKSDKTIPKLLEMLAIEEAIVAIDAMGCQRDIAQKIVGRKADYVLALKGNQGGRPEDVELFVAEQKAAAFQDTRISPDQTVDGDHGRIETRTTTVIHDFAWLQERHDWPGLRWDCYARPAAREHFRVRQYDRPSGLSRHSPGSAEEGATHTER
ncbi:MAG: ISAs1 family transposase [Acetobacteraceae bacterium]